jgi:osmoprotectant transport system ATP-binding protein
MEVNGLIYQQTAADCAAPGGLVYLAHRLADAISSQGALAPGRGFQVSQSGSGGAQIDFDGVSKRYGTSDRPAIDDLTISIPAGEICVLIGPSGGGKTTALKMINRLISITEGDITVDGTSVNGLEKTELRRGMGYVIQQIGLFPHMTIEANIGTVPRLLGWDKARIRARARELLDLVGLEPDEHGRRYPYELSGGQRQRVGLARAMAADPPVMLMDEPFGAIDPITRERLQDDFLRLHGEIRKTVVFVTHDIDEAIKMGDRICILREGGKLAQYDTPEAILARPADDFVARFVGADRGLKRLALRRLDEVELLPVPERDGDAPECAAHTTLRDALSLMLTEGSTGVLVRGEDGSAKGFLTFEVVSRLLSQGEPVA